MDKIKVVWLCHFSNTFVHSKLELGYSRFTKVLLKMAHRPVSLDVPEFANWVTNGIAEFEKIEDVELHIISPYPHMKHRTQEFVSNGIRYHFFQSEDDNVWNLFYRKIAKPSYWAYKRNRKTILSIIDSIQPQVVHLFGAENPGYSMGILDVPKEMITIAQLQTLMNDPDFQKNYPISPRMYQFRSSVEKEIIKKVDYPATPAVKYRNIICQDIRSNATILNLGLALHDPIVKDETEKVYDFVYFAANLSKAADLALEAFGKAFQQKPELTLDIVGGCDVSFKQVLDEIIHRYGMEKAVRFEGRLPSHDDVLTQIRKSRYALLPLRIDLTSGTIREAMSNGLPVLTTDTGELGTQKLNAGLSCVLISQVGDHEALAANMLRLLEDTELAETLRQNSYKSRDANKTNEETSLRYMEAYNACINYKKKGIPIPNELTEI